MEQVPNLHFDSLNCAVFYNLPVSDLQFLNGVEEINELDCSFNESLTSCEGLSDEVHIERLYIKNNPLLTECAVEAICEKAGQSTYEFNVSDNGLGCSSVEEIAEICYPDSLFCYQKNLYLNGQDEVNEIWNIKPKCLNSIRDIVIKDKSGSNKVTDLPPLMRFKSLDILRITGLDSLETLDGVQNLDYVGQLDIFRCNSLVTLDEFKSSIEIGKEVGLFENLKLNNLSSFLISNPVPLINIRYCDLLTQGEYDKLDKVQGLILGSMFLQSTNFINENPNLEILDMTDVGGNLDLNLQNTSGITDLLIGFQSSPISIRNIVFSDSVSRIIINQNEIPIWSVLKPPAYINQIIFSNNNFQSFDFESNVRSIGVFSFGINNGITGIDFLDSLEYLNDFNVISNFDLQKIGKTSNLVNNLEDFTLFLNPLLEVIEGFDNEIVSANIEIDGNPILNDCNIGIVCNTLSSRVGSVDIDINGEDCDYENIVLNCGIQNSLRSITIRNQLHSAVMYYTTFHSA